MAASSLTNSYERICSDLTVLASLDSAPGQDRKLVYSKEKGLDSEYAGFYRTFLSNFNFAASFLRLDSGYTRDISDLTPIIGNIRDYCVSGLDSLDTEKLKILVLKIDLAAKGLIQHIKKYAGQQVKEEIISDAIHQLEESHQIVERHLLEKKVAESQLALQRKVQSEGSDYSPDKILEHSKELTRVMQSLLRDLGVSGTAISEETTPPPEAQ